MTPAELKDALTPNGMLAMQLDEAGIAYSREFKFAPRRKWRADFLMLECNSPCLVEVNGGIWTNGRHTRGAALQDEYRKISEAGILGYRILIVTPQDVKDGSALALIKRALGR